MRFSKQSNLELLNIFPWLPWYVLLNVLDGLCRIKLVEMPSSSYIFAFEKDRWSKCVSAKMKNNINYTKKVTIVYKWNIPFYLSPAHFQSSRSPRSWLHSPVGETWWRHHCPSLEILGWHFFESLSTTVVALEYKQPLSYSTKIQVRNVIFNVHCMCMRNVLIRILRTTICVLAVIKHACGVAMLGYISNIDNTLLACCLAVDQSCSDTMSRTYRWSLCVTSLNHDLTWLLCRKLRSMLVAAFGEEPTLVCVPKIRYY